MMICLKDPSLTILSAGSKADALWFVEPLQGPGSSQDVPCKHMCLRACQWWTGTCDVCHAKVHPQACCGESGRNESHDACCHCNFHGWGHACHGAPWNWYIWCVCRHQRLRRAYTIICLTEGGAMLDTHLDFVTGGGWSEHAIFLSQLMAAWNT